MPRSRPYKVGLDQRLKDPEYAASYLNAAQEVSQEVFLLALRDVVQARKISKVASAAGVNRETLYRTLSSRGNPTLATLESILAALGVQTNYRARSKRKRYVSRGYRIEGTHPDRELTMRLTGELAEGRPWQSMTVVNCSRSNAPLAVNSDIGAASQFGPVISEQPSAIEFHLGR